MNPNCYHLRIGIVVCTLLMCSCWPSKEISYYIGEADVVVYNLSKGDSIYYKGKSIASGSSSFGGGITIYNSVSVSVNDSEYYKISLSESQTDTVFFEPLDSLRICFIPPAEFPNDKYTVEFRLLDQIININSRPYMIDYLLPLDVPKGVYDILCRAMSNTWDEESSKCVKDISIRIK